MKIEYTLNRKHIWQYHWYQLKRHFLSSFLKLAAIPVFLSCLNFTFGSGSGTLKNLAFSAAIGFVMLLVQIVSYMLVVLYRFWKALKPSAIGSRVAEIGKFDFRWGRPDSAGHYYHWTRFENVISTHNFLYFILKKKMVLIVPKAAFTDASKAAKFFEQAWLYWDVAKTNERYSFTAKEGVWPPPPRIDQ